MAGELALQSLRFTTVSTPDHRFIASPYRLFPSPIHSRLQICTVQQAESQCSYRRVYRVGFGAPGSLAAFCKSISPMADGLNLVASIYEGVWTNWSRGGVWGLTWTLSPTHAVIVTNALAVLVTFCGVQLFNLIRHTLCEVVSRPRSIPVTPHLKQEQDILKTEASDMATAQGMLSLAWNHRRSSGRRSLRSYSIGMFALIYTVLFWIAGIFSNRAISMSSTSGPWEVLSRSTNCGIWNQTYV